jgi:hypothetical protein
LAIVAFSLNGYGNPIREVQGYGCCKRTARVFPKIFQDRMIHSVRVWRASNGLAATPPAEKLKISLNQMIFVRLIPSRP